MNYKRLPVNCLKYFYAFALALTLSACFVVFQALSFTSTPANAQSGPDSNLARARSVLNQAISDQQEDPSAKQTKAARRAFKAYRAIVRARLAQIEPELQHLKRLLKQGGHQHKQRIDELEAEIIELTSSVADARHRLERKGPVIISADPTSCVENFDNVIAPALPAGWAATLSGDACGSDSSPWKVVNTNSDSAPNSAFAPGPFCVNDNQLDSLPLQIQASTARLTFLNQYNLEEGFDGTVLEISIGDGPFQDILTAGGSFVTGGYTRTISPDFGSPIGGRQAWSGNSGGFITTTVDLPASASGQSIKLRWRTATDTSVSDAGQFIDSIAITGCKDCLLSCPSNITVSNAPGQCGAVVNYASPTADGNCGAVTCAPSSGSFFPVGVTNVTCDSATGYSCSFAIRVNDTEAPAITCPANITAITAAPGNTLTVVNYATPTGSDNCGTASVVCNPPSGSAFPVGTTTVTCQANDTSGNTSACTFKITVFDVCIQDNSNGSNVLLFNSFNGDYVICCGGTRLVGRGVVTKASSTIALSHSTADRRLSAKVNTATFTGTASVQFPVGILRCQMTDSNIRDNTCICQ